MLRISSSTMVRWPHNSHKPFCVSLSTARVAATRREPRLPAPCSIVPVGLEPTRSVNGLQQQLYCANKGRHRQDEQEGNENPPHPVVRETTGEPCRELAPNQHRDHVRGDDVPGWCQVALTGRFFGEMACKAGPRRGGGDVDVGLGPLWPPVAGACLFAQGKNLPLRGVRWRVVISTRWVATAAPVTSRITKWLVPTAMRIG